jgi:hypothetical protein
MKFMLMFKPETNPPPGVHPCRKDLPAMRQLMMELKEAGILLATEGLQGSETGARIHHGGGRFVVTDGPFAEAKELIAGFAIVNVSSKQEAIDIARRFLDVAGEGVREVLQVIEG